MTRLLAKCSLLSLSDGTVSVLWGATKLGHTCKKDGDAELPGFADSGSGNQKLKDKGCSLIFAFAFGPYFPTHFRHVVGTAMEAETLFIIRCFETVHEYFFEVFLGDTFSGVTHFDKRVIVLTA